MLTGLGHRAIRRTHDQDGSVHLGGTGNHVLDVVGVSWAVHVSIVALLGLVFQVGDGDGDATLPLFWSLVDLVEGGVFVAIAHGCQHLGDGGGQGGFAVVDVSNRAHVHVRLIPLKLLLCHAF